MRWPIRHRGKLAVFSKRALSLTAVGILLTSTAVYAGLGGFTDPPSPINLDQGLLAYWKMDNNAQDSSGNGIHGSVVGSTGISDRRGNANSALSFNGTASDYVNVPNSSTLNPNGDEYSFSLWFRADAAGTLNGSILYNQENFIEASAGGGYFTYAWMPNWAWFGGTSFPVTVGEWYHATVVYDGVNQYMYKNGQLVFSRAQTGNMTFNANRLAFATRGTSGGGSSPFNGAIDEARIYGRALNAQEVSYLYSQFGGSGSSKLQMNNTQKGLLGHWKFDGDNKDSTPQASNGTSSGTSYAADRKGMSNGARTFNGTSDYVYARIGDGTHFGQNRTLSAAAWVYVTATSSGPVFGVTATPPGGGWNMPFLSINGTTVYGWIWNGTAMSATVTANAWHHLAITYDPAANPTQRFYVDGQQVATANTQYSPSGGVDYFTTYITGAKPSGVSSYLNTPIDDVRAYDRVLSAQEIAALNDSYDAVVSVSDLQKDLSGSWPLNGNAKDSTPYANNGTVSGAALTTDRRGRANSAYSFTTKSDVIDIGNVAGSVITASMWYYFNGTGGTWNTLLCHDGGSQHHLLIQNSTNLIGFYNGSFYSSGYSLTPGIWYHLALVKNGTNSKLYIDGILRQDSNSSFSNDTYQLSRIGNYGGNSQGSLGTIDDVRVWSRALGADEIQRLVEIY